MSTYVDLLSQCADNFVTILCVFHNMANDTIIMTGAPNKALFNTGLKVFVSKLNTMTTRT